MRTKYLNQMRIIECLINNRNLSLKQIRIMCREMEDASHVKTLRRALDELTEEQYIICSDGLYRLNNEKFSPNNYLIDDDLKRLLNCAIESGEIDCYRKIKELIKPELQDDLLSDEALERFKHTVIENINLLNDDEDKIRALKAAIHKKIELQVSYKGEVKQVMPLRIVVSRDGMRNYLFGLRRNELKVMELSQIYIVKALQEKYIENEEEHLEKIKRSWDIDIQQKPVYVKILLRKAYDSGDRLGRQLQNYFGDPVLSDEETCVFEGSLIGINDFKKWVREHMEACCVLEPKGIRQELAEALKVKIGRYEING